MIERPLIAPSLVFLFAAIMGTILHTLIPNDFQLAKLRASSHQAPDAEALIRNTASLESEDAVALRHLADILENQGKIEEAVDVAKRLTQLRPRNLEYWQRLIRLQEWNNRPLDATRSSERLILNGLVEPNRGNLVRLAKDYEWLQAYADRDRVYVDLVKRKLYESPDVLTIIRIALGQNDITTAEKIAREAEDLKIVGRYISYEMLRLYLEFGKPEKAVQELARFFGASSEVVSNAWSNLSYLELISYDFMKTEEKLFNDIYSSYAARGMQNEAFPLLERMGAANILYSEKLLELVELLIERSKRDSALQMLKNIKPNNNFSPAQWQKTASLFQQLGDNQIAAAILEALLDGRSPQSVIDGKPQSNYKKTLTQLLYAELSSNIRSDATSNFQTALTTKPPLSEQIRGNNRKETLLQLLELYEKSGPPEKIESQLERILSESKQKKIQLSSQEDVKIREKLSERHLWSGSADKAVEVLKSIPNKSLGAKSKVIRSFSLMDLKRVDEAIETARLLSSKERSTLDPATLKRLKLIDQIDAERKTFKKNANAANRVDKILPEPDRILAETTPQKASKQLKSKSTRRLNSTSKALLSQNPIPSPSLPRSVRDSAYNDLLYSAKDLAISASTIASGSATLSSIDAKWRARSGSNRWGWSSHFVGSRVFTTNQSLGSVRLGGELATEKALIRTEAGYQYGGPFLQPQFYAEVSGSNALLDFGILSFDLAKPLAESEGLASNGVSESRSELYYERRLTQWLEITGGGLLRFTHLGEQFDRGRGVEWTTRLGFGAKESRWRIGPYSYLLWWGTTNGVLRPLLASRYTILGSFASVDWGGRRKSNLRGRIALGVGYDFTGRTGEKITSYLESSAEKLLSEAIAMKFEYARYIAGTTQTLGTGTHIFRLSLVWGIN